MKNDTNGPAADHAQGKLVTKDYRHYYHPKEVIDADNCPKKDLQEPDEG